MEEYTMIRRFKITTKMNPSELNCTLFDNLARYAIFNHVWVKVNGEGKIVVTGFVRKKNIKEFSHYVRHYACSENDLAMVITTKLW